MTSRDESTRARRCSTAALAWVGLFVMGMLLAGCRTNELPEYAPRIQTAYVATFADGRPTVAFGSSADQGLAGTFADMTALGMSFELQEKLERVLERDALAAVMTQTFRQDLGPSFGWQVVQDRSAAHDSLVEIRVSDFGLTAASMDSPVYFFFDADARIVFMPENKLVWEYSGSIAEPLTPSHLSGFGVFSGVGTAINLDALNKLTDAQLAQVFDRLAADAGATFVAQMREDAWD